MSNSVLYNDLFREEQDSYSASFVMQNRLMEWFSDSLIGKKVLDIGCGGGKYSLAFKRLGADVTAVDIHDAGAGVLDHFGIVFLLGNALHLPVAKPRFDVTFSCGVAHHTGNTELALSEQVRVTKKGGLVYFAVYRESFYFKALRFLRKFRSVIPRRPLQKMIGFDVDNLYAEHMDTYHRWEVVEMMKRNGVRVTSYWQGKKLHRFIGVKE